MVVPRMATRVAQAALPWKATGLTTSEKIADQFG